jgi:hypothetical protein
MLYSSKTWCDVWNMLDWWNYLISLHCWSGFWCMFVAVVSVMCVSTSECNCLGQSECWLHTTGAGPQDARGWSSFRSSCIPRPYLGWRRPDVASLRYGEEETSPEVWEQGREILGISCIASVIHSEFVWRRFSSFSFIYIYIYIYFFFLFFYLLLFYKVKVALSCDLSLH